MPSALISKPNNWSILLKYKRREKLTKILNKILKTISVNYIIIV
jgi:hypothetical protein